MGLVKKAKTFTHVLLSLDIRIQELCPFNIIAQKKNFERPVVKFAGNMRRKDLVPELISKNNMIFRNKLGNQLNQKYKSCPTRGL